ncbi:MAG: M20 family metallopeptidase [Emergencia sp.]|nr:M20 family metallopeptidase [Emergencia sp.]
MENIIREITEMDLGSLVSDMIKIPSYSFMEEQEREIAFFIKDFFDREKIPCEVTEIAEGRYNVTAVLKGRGTGKSLMLSGHLDTVPAYDMEHAFAGKVQDGKVFGRGACDMKGPLAAMMAAMAALKRSGTILEGDVYFTGVADEEENGKGAAYLIEHGPAADGVIVGEPTELALAPGHKGLEWIRVTFKGKKVHGGRQKEGINAIEMAARFIREVYEVYTPVLESRSYPVLGAPTINIGTICGGDQPSTVADYCEIRLDRRMVPSETIFQVYDELAGIGRKLHAEDERFCCTIEDVFAEDKTLPHIPFFTEDTDPLMASMKTAIVERGLAVVIEPFPAWTDAGFIADKTCAKCVVFGPGSIKVAHSVQEFIDISEVYKAAEIYAACAISYCGKVR